jgi:mRNA-degrading endonuclease RelE of RelBE toxin-antitoxin system
MSPSHTHQWLLIIDERAQQVFDTLADSEKSGIFRQLRLLLRADDPYSVSSVQMVKGKKFQRVRKFRIGNYRVFFYTEAEEVTHQEHTYKGTLFLLDIRKRKEAY